MSSDSETRAREVLSGIDSYPVPVSSEHVERKERGDQANPKSKTTKKNEDHGKERRDPFCSESPEWLQEFRENLVDDRVPECRDSHALEPKPARSADLGKHSVYTHFPKDRNCEIRKRTKITRAPCRRRIGGAVLGAEHVGDLITADHKVLSEGCESRNNPRYAFVVQDTKELAKVFWSQIGSLKLFTLTIPWNLAKLVKIFPGIIARLHHTDRRLMVLQKEQCAE